MSISDTTTLNTAPILDLGQYTFQISPQGLANLSKVTDPADPARNIVWTIDPKIEIPIIMTKDGVGAIPPITVMELWKNLLPTLGKKPALSEKINGKWQTISYNEYYDLAVKFALGLIRLGISERSAVSILGYNCSNWFIDFFGAIFANCVACGHYLTNAPDAVAFVIQHSDSEVFIAENQEQLDKVLQIWDQVPNLKYAHSLT
jgi:long-chain-fatty-acid--CoA ligase ACSBG